MSNLKIETQNFKPLFTLGAQVLIFNEKQEILLCHRTDKDLWNFPGGVVEQNETAEEAAIREAKEEIKIEVKIDKFLGAYFKPQKNDVMFSFLAHIFKGELTSSSEADEIKYFSKENLPINFSTHQKERIFNALNSFQTIFRKQYY